MTSAKEARADGGPGSEREGSAAAPHAPAQPANPVASIERLALLKKEFEANAARQPALDAPPWSKLLQQLKRHWDGYSRSVKAAVAVLVVLVVGWAPVRALLQTTSTEAVLNARLITLRAPIEGEVQVEGSFTVGTALAANASVLHIVNRRADRARLDDLNRLIDQLESERETLLSRITDLSVTHTELRNQVRLFQEGRMRQLAARGGELASELAVAKANWDAALQALKRVEPMAHTGTIAAATLEKYRRDAIVTQETHAAVEHRLEALQVEMKAIQAGTFIGDTYNDQPRSLQRIDEINHRLNELTADVRDRDARIFTLRKELAQETKLLLERSDAILVTPVNATIWEILTSPGETVVRGQDLVRLLDCSGVVVTAAVSESVYNRLHIGQSASFVLRGESKAQSGRIVSLTGLASAPANLAIQPSALLKEPYRVTIRLDGVDPTTQCNVGRTGRVMFGQ